MSQTKNNNDPSWYLIPNYWASGIFLAPIILVGLWQLITPARELRRVFFDYALTPKLFWQQFADGQFLQNFDALFGHAFLHGSPYSDQLTLMHLGMNAAMMAVLVFGLLEFAMVKQYTSHFRHFGGHPKLWHRGWLVWDRFAMVTLFYLASIPVAAILPLILQMDSAVKIVGASGGASALLGAYLRMPIFRDLRAKIGAFTDEDAASFKKQTSLIPLTDRFVMISALLVVVINGASAVVFDWLSGGRILYQWDIHLSGFLFGLFGFPLFWRWFSRD